MGFSRQGYWAVLLCPPPEDLPHPGIESGSLSSPASAGRFFTTSATWEAPYICVYKYITEPLCYMAESSTTLYINYASIKCILKSVQKYFFLKDKRTAHVLPRPAQLSLSLQGPGLFVLPSTSCHILQRPLLSAPPG